MKQIYEKPIFIDFAWLVSVLSSSMECYDDECMGLLGGEMKKNGLQLFATPLITAERGPGTVHYNNQPDKYELSKEIINTLGLNVVGCYHSHPDDSPTPSDDDIDCSIFEHITVDSQDISSFDWWLEMIIGISKIDYKYNFKPTFSFKTDDYALTGKIKHGHIGWNIDIKGHWIQPVELPDEGYHPNRQPAIFEFKEKNFPSAWEFE